MSPLFWGVGLPAVLFLLSLRQVAQCMKKGGQAAADFMWMFAYTMVFCIAGIWLATTLSGGLHASLAPERAAAMRDAGIPLFVTFLIILSARVVLAKSASALLTLFYQCKRLASYSARLISRKN